MLPEGTITCLITHEEHRTQQHTHFCKTGAVTAAWCQHEAPALTWTHLTTPTNMNPNQSREGPPFHSVAVLSVRLYTSRICASPAQSSSPCRLHAPKNNIVKQASLLHAAVKPALHSPVLPQGTTLHSRTSRMCMHC